MGKPILVGVLVSAIVFAVAFNLGGDDLVKFYGDKLRASMFSAFLTLGGFLLSLKTFVVVKMKEALYDSPRYRARAAERRQRVPGENIFGGVDMLRRLLFVAIVSSLCTAVCQLSVGLYDSKATAAASIAAGGFTIALLAQVLFRINGNLRTWFEFLEADAVEKEVKDKAERAEKDRAADAAQRVAEAPEPEAPEAAADAPAGAPAR